MAIRILACGLTTDENNDHDACIALDNRSTNLRVTTSSRGAATYNDLMRIIQRYQPTILFVGCDYRKAEAPVVLPRSVEWFITECTIPEDLTRQYPNVKMAAIPNTMSRFPHLMHMGMDVKAAIEMAVTMDYLAGDEKCKLVMPKVKYYNMEPREAKSPTAVPYKSIFASKPKPLPKPTVSTPSPKSSRGEICNGIYPWLNNAVNGEEDGNEDNTHEEDYTDWQEDEPPQNPSDPLVIEYLQPPKHCDGKIFIYNPDGLVFSIETPDDVFIGLSSYTEYVIINGDTFTIHYEDREYYVVSMMCDISVLLNK
jgi:hypothetical protein